jgi:hypothetical protein
MKTTIPAGTLLTPYGQKIYKHLLKSARRMDHWSHQPNVQSLTKEEKIWYDRSRAVKGALAEMAFFKLLCLNEVEFVHNNKIPIKAGRRKLEKDIDFTLLPSGLNIDVKSQFSRANFAVLDDTAYHAYVYIVPQIPTSYVANKNGLSLIRYPNKLFKQEIEVEVLGISSVDGMKKNYHDWDKSKLMPISDFFGNLKMFY